MVARIGAHDAALVERLRTPAVQESFCQVQAQFEIGDNVGLVSFPEVGGYYTTAALPEVWIDAQGNYKHLKGAGGLFPPLEHVVPAAEASERVILAPKLNPQGEHRVVSIYQKKGFCDPEPVYDERILEAPNAVFTGLFAHELAHYLDIYFEIPQHAEDVLKQLRKAAFAGGLIATQNYEEAGIDTVAGLMGFKQETIVTLEYMRQCVQSYTIANKPHRLATIYNWIYPSEIIDIIDFRLEMVRTFCP